MGVVIKGVLGFLFSAVFYFGYGYITFNSKILGNKFLIKHLTDINFLASNMLSLGPEEIREDFADMGKKIISDTVSEGCGAFGIPCKLYLSFKVGNLTDYKKTYEKLNDTFPIEKYSKILKENKEIISGLSIGKYGKSLINKINLGLSFGKLGWSFIEYKIIQKQYDNIENYEDELDKMKKLFNAHCKEFNNLKNLNTSEKIKKMEDMLENLKDDREDLLKFIKKVNKNIKNVKWGKTKSQLGVGIDVLGTAYNVHKLATEFSPINLISLGVNLLSGYFDAKNWSSANDIINKLEKLLADSNKLLEEITNQINEITNLLSHKSK